MKAEEILEAAAEKLKTCPVVIYENTFELVEDISDELAAMMRSVATHWNTPDDGFVSHNDFLLLSIAEKIYGEKAE